MEKVEKNFKISKYIEYGTRSLWTHQKDKFIGAGSCYYFNKKIPVISDIMKIFSNKLKNDTITCSIFSIVVEKGGDVIEMRTMRFVYDFKNDDEFEKYYNEVLSYSQDLIKYAESKYCGVTCKFYFNILN
jgi:hypothetical protein